jgi:hypothetical protein
MKAPVAPPGPLADVVRWVQNLIRLPQPRKVYTLATLPAAADFDGATVPVSDGVSNQPTVTSVGGTWRYQSGVAA